MDNIKIQIEIVDRPIDRKPNLIPVTPGGLQDALIQASQSGRAVKFATDETHMRKLYWRIKTHMGKLGYTVHFQTDRPHSRRHRDKTAAFKVVMWLESKDKPSGPQNE